MAAEGAPIEPNANAGSAAGAGSIAVPGFGDVRAAAERIAGRVHNTPVMTSATLDAELGVEIFCKVEALQKTGAFKARGALNAVLALDDAAASRGVLTHSSGNHGAALAWAARQRGIPCTVVTPRDGRPNKLAAMRQYGAELILCDRADRATVTEREQERTGATVIHPFENPQVIAGQGTAALELLDEVHNLDAVIAPIGGGGLLAGTAITCSARADRITVRGAEPFAVDDAYRSLESGERQPGVLDPNTCADGLMTGIGAPNFAILHRLGVRVIRVTEEAIAEAVEFFRARMKLVIEPSGATALAAVRAWSDRPARVGLLLTGGNA